MTHAGVGGSIRPGALAGPQSGLEWFSSRKHPDKKETLPHCKAAPTLSQIVDSFKVDLRVLPPTDTTPPSPFVPFAEEKRTLTHRSQPYHKYQVPACGEGGGRMLFWQQEHHQMNSAARNRTRSCEILLLLKHKDAYGMNTRSRLRTLSTPAEWLKGSPRPWLRKRGQKNNEIVSSAVPTNSGPRTFTPGAGIGDAQSFLSLSLCATACNLPNLLPRAKRKCIFFPSSVENIIFWVQKWVYQYFYIEKKIHSHHEPMRKSSMHLSSNLILKNN